MFVPRLGFSICYLFILIIQRAASSSSCVYDVDHGQKLDIRTLGNSDGKRPKYDNIPNTSPVKSSLSWNGCFPYSKFDGGNCKDAAACLTSTTTGQSALIVRPSAVKFEHEENVNLLVYQSGETTLTVYLTCADIDEDKINSRQDSPTIFNIYLQSRCCCPGKCHFSTQSGSLTGGAVFVILLVSVLFAYIVGGMLFLKYARGATGTDIIPHRMIWLNVVSYVLDGLRYTLQIIRQRGLNVDYQKI
ncbi:unnamed protein product [Rotaria socialis]|uniref:Cation-dependent mannose-6-phosphate receptor n=1 Tax=Rotaria socialis TaxID=392032 RepID=A0A820TAU2_9BILA|nr:unnamed protein product [Rotaria socialis]CAF3385697.1 unnamed protein product [Rotaria socialis]CAF4462942.1 unnamed protein product [Rotaria socialis]CAF4620622.1 unnamed protein product [Rotaria socialis]